MYDTRTSVESYQDVQSEDDKWYPYYAYVLTFDLERGNLGVQNLETSIRVFLSGRHLRARKWTLKLSGYVPLDLRTKFCCPDTALGSVHTRNFDPSFDRSSKGT